MVLSIIHDCPLVEITDACPNCGRHAPLRCESPDNEGVGLIECDDGTSYYADGQCPGCQVYLVTPDFTGEKIRSKQ